MIGQAIFITRRFKDRLEAVRRHMSVPPNTLMWMSYINYSIGALIIMLLRPTRVTANWVTIASLVIHVVGAMYVATLTAPVKFLDAFLLLVIWQLGVSLDCADGPLARARKKTSSFGAWLDQVSDFLAHTMTMSSLSIFVVRAHELSAVIAVLLTATLMGANLLLLHGLLLKNVNLGSAGATSQGNRSLMIRLLGQGKQLTDTGLFLFVSALLTLVPRALFMYLVAMSILSLLWMLASIASNWRRQGRTTSGTVEEKGTR